MSSWKMSDALRHQIYKYAKLPQTGVSLRQMVQFGPRPSQGTLFHASYFAVHELPIRLSHRVRELENLPLGLSEEPSIKLVRDWYAQSFEELMEVDEPELSEDMRDLLLKHRKDDSFWENNLLFNDELESKRIPQDKDNFIFDDDGIFINRKKKKILNDNEQEIEVNFNKVEEIKKNDDSLIKDWDSSSANGSGLKEIDEIDRPLGLKTYFQSCPNDILYPKEITDYNKLVTKTLIKIKRRHDATVATLARGVQNWKQKNNYKYLNSPINQFLDRFYMSRIGIRMLIGQTIAINQQSEKNMQNDDYVGIICLHCNIKEILQDAIDAARFACEEHFNIMDVPKVKLYCPSDLTFRYVPGHLVHMLYETLKNSLRATIEHHSKLNPNTDLDDIKYPPIKIIVAKGDEDITIKISDEGGGIPRSAIPLVWTYFYTSAEKQLKDDDLQDFANNHKVPFMGLGVGLPHSRLYARYFSGDLKLISMEGYGTDVYLHLNRLSSSTEPLQ
jgi:pyruvate dehydrogenase kinase 2/3/4